jgi:peptidoglycan/LPS O-acetylase OafA/YrhL
MPTWLRWVVVLPTAIASYLGIQILIGLQSEMAPFPDILQDLWSQGLNSIIGPWAFVYSGARVAPRRWILETGVTLAVFYGIFTGAIATLALLDPTPTYSPWWLAICALLGIVTVIATCVQLRKQVALESMQRQRFRRVGRRGDRINSV